MRFYIPEERWKPPYPMQGETYNRLNNGLERDEFEIFLKLGHYSQSNIIYHVRDLYSRLRPKYTVLYDHKIKDKIDECLREGLILSDRGRLTVSGSGRRLISKWYYLKIFVNHPLTLELIKWSAIILITHILASAGIKIATS